MSRAKFKVTRSLPIVPFIWPCCQSEQASFYSFNRRLCRGATGGNRTHNPLIKSPLLYQLSYRRIGRIVRPCFKFSVFKEQSRCFPLPWLTHSVERCGPFNSSGFASCRQALFEEGRSFFGPDPCLLVRARPETFKRRAPFVRPLASPHRLSPCHGQLRFPRRRSPPWQECCLMSCPRLQAKRAAHVFFFQRADLARFMLGGSHW